MSLAGHLPRRRDSHTHFTNPRIPSALTYIAVASQWVMKTFRKTPNFMRKWKPLHCLPVIGVAVAVLIALVFLDQKAVFDAPPGAGDLRA